MDQDFAQKVFDLSDNSKSIVITSHTSPDDDSIASVLSIYRLLSTKYADKKIRIVYTGTSNERYKTFADFDKIEFVDDMADHLDDCDLLIMLDGNQFTRFSKKLSPEVYKNKSICIDHHASPPSQFTLSLIRPKAMATVELIYELFFIDQNLDKQTAEILLIGLLGDTGDFTYLRPGNVSVFDMAKKLLTVADCEIQELKARYSTISLRIFAAVQEFVKNTSFSEVTNWPKFMYSYLSRDFFNQNKLTDNDVSDANHIYETHYLRIIADHSWGFTISPKNDGRCGISLRSLPSSVNVRAFAEVVGGGGHDRAAGGDFKSTDGTPIQPEDCVEKLKRWMETNKPVLS